MLNKTFIEGLKAIAPLTLTLVFSIMIFRTIEDFFRFLIIKIMPPEYYFVGLGALVGMAFVFAIGLLVNAWIFKKLYALGEYFLHRIPIIKTLYSGIVDMVQFFGSEKQKKGKPVLIETPYGKIIGFVTRETFNDLEGVMETDDEVAVYIPLSYQIGGFTLFMKKSELNFLDLSVEKAMRFVLTAGITQILAKKKNKNETE